MDHHNTKHHSVFDQLYALPPPPVLYSLVWLMDNPAQVWGVKGVLRKLIWNSYKIKNVCLRYVYQHVIQTIFQYTILFIVTYLAKKYYLCQKIADRQKFAKNYWPIVQHVLPLPYQNFANICCLVLLIWKISIFVIFLLKKKSSNKFSYQVKSCHFSVKSCHFSRKIIIFK